MAEIHDFRARIRASGCVSRTLAAVGSLNDMICRAREEAHAEGSWGVTGGGRLSLLGGVII